MAGAAFDVDDTGPPVTGVVLAGGSSRRMGRDKALLEVDGSRLIDRAIRRLEPLCRRILVAGGERSIPDLRAAQIPDDPEASGPLAGILAGLSAAGEGHVAVVAVDMPDASAAVLRALAGRVDDHAGVVPEVGGRLQPLHAVYRADTETALRRIARTGERSVVAAVRALDVLVAGRDVWGRADPAGRFARNLNTPEDLGP